MTPRRWPPCHGEVVDIASHRRQPLGLRPVIEPGDEPEDEDRAEVTSEARYAEIMAWRTAHGGNRGAFLSDIDALIERASKTERRFVFAVMGEILGETMAEIAHDLRAEFGRTPETPDAPPAKVAELELENAKLRASVGELAAKVGQLDFVVERLRVEARGPTGQRQDPVAATAPTALEVREAKRANGGHKVRGRSALRLMTRRSPSSSF